MKTLVLLLALLFSHAALSDDALNTLKRIDKDAIFIGNGPTDAYAVIDPQCLRSRDFIDAITANANLRRMYRYHLFLYDMPQADSASVIRAIYSAPSPKAALIDYMLHHRLPPNPANKTSPRVRATMQRINAAVDYFGMSRTPYLVIDKQTK